MTYAIRNTSHEGTLRTLGLASGHASVEHALAALRRYIGAAGRDLCSKPGADGEHYVYLDGDTMERDDSDSCPFAVIEPEEQRC
jgi:hypothetical protein